MNMAFVVVVLRLATQKKNTRTTSCIHRPSFTSNVMNVAHCFSFTCCGKKTMIMSATFIVMVLELVKQKN